jgi:hypothetical protein
MELMEEGDGCGIWFEEPYCAALKALFQTFVMAGFG